ncbi:protein IWS1 homolog A-like [Littorina saxatilis]|uniref:protein IWS1 homolog A-like n=1 Tax=Littorina saxatilis TaxID=31220 RepID=UPI0038B5947D
MAARPETLQQFEDAFEELYRRSPMPQLPQLPKGVRIVPPLLFSRQSPMPLIPRQDGTKVKAIFDMMKWKNCSMSSELNTSVATSKSACGGDNDTSSNVGVMVQKEKENLTPEKATDGLSNLSGQRSQAEVFLSGTSPQASDSRDTLNDSQGDQETLQLVSKLVERLHSSNDKDSDRDDDWDVTDSCNAQASSPVTTWPREDSVSVVQVLDRGPKSRSTGNRWVELRSGKNAPSENVTNAATSAKIDNSAASAKNGAAGNNSVIAAMLKVVGNKTAENNSRKTPENHTTEDANDREVCNRNRPARQGARTFDKEKIPQEIRSQKSTKTSTNQSESQRNKSTSSNTTTLRLRRKRGASIIEDSSADEVVIEATTETQTSLKRKNSIMEDSSANEVVIEATTETQTSLKRKNSIMEDSSANEVVIEATTEKQTSLKRKNGIREDSSDSEITITAKTKKLKSLKRKNSIMADSSDDQVTITAKTEKQKSLKRKNSTMKDSSDDEITKKETTEKRTSLKGKTSIMIDSSDHGEVTKTTTEKQRPLKRRTGIIEDSSENEEAVKNAAREKRCHGIVRFDKAADEAVDSDVIHMQTRSQMTDRKDPFSLDSSGNEDVMEVENDVILYASQKSQQNPKPTRRNEQKRSVSKVTRSRANAAKEEIHLDKQSMEDKQKVVKLYSWSLQPIPWMTGVRIEGKLPNSDYFWVSSVIVERVTNRLLKSTNGSLFRLVGTISVHNTKAAGFSRELIRLFRHGFPTDWKELIESSFAASNEMNTSREPEPASKDGKPPKTKTEVPTHPPRSLEATSVSNTRSKSRDPSQIQTQGKPTDKDAETCQQDAASTNAEPPRASRGALKHTGLKQKPERLATPPQQRRLDPRSFLTPDQQKKDLEESTASENNPEYSGTPLLRPPKI